LASAVQTLIGAAIDETRAKRGTALTVLPPFHTFTTDTQMIEDTPDQYKIRMHHAEKKLLAPSSAQRKRPASHARWFRSSMSTPTGPSSTSQRRNAAI
jgi:hypothetical protein